MRMRIDEEIDYKKMDQILNCISTNALNNIKITNEETLYLKKNGLLGFFETLQKKRMIESRNILRRIHNKIIVDEIKHVVDALNVENIEFLIFKGFALSSVLYDEVIQRPYSDVDIIVNPNHSKKADLILQDLGYENPYSRDYTITRGQIVRRKKLTAHDISVELDIHFFMFGNFLIRDIFCFDDLYKDRQEIIINSCRFYTISTSHAFIHTCIHFFMHNKKNDLVKLVWLLDIKRFCDIYYDQIKVDFYKIVKEKKLGHIIYSSMCDSNKYFSIDSNKIKDVECFVSENPEGKLGFENSSKIVIYLKQFLVINGMKSKLIFLQDTTIPDIKLLRLKYGNFPNYLFPYYITLRWYKLFLKK